MDIKKLAEDLEKELNPVKTGEDLVKELLEIGYKNFIFIEDGDASNHIECRDLKDLDDTLEDYTDNDYTYEWFKEDELYLDPSHENLLEVAEWKGVVCWEVEPVDEPWYTVHDERRDYIVIDMNVKNDDGISIYDYLKERLDLE